MSVGNYFNLIEEDFSDLKIVKENRFDCKIINSIGEVYQGFLLASTMGGNAHTLCDVHFHLNANDKFIPRLTFRKTDSSFDDKKVSSSQKYVRITFASSQDGCYIFWKMISFLYSFKDIVDIGDFQNHYGVVNHDDIVIDGENSANYIKKIISSGYGEDMLNILLNSDSDIISTFSHARIQYERGRDLQELKDRLNKHYAETKGDDSWQRRIFEHNRLFGANYLEPLEKQKINLSGIMPDYLFPTVDGFVDVLEIKLPNDEVILADSSHSGSWRRTAESNKAIGQVANYLCEIDRMQLEIQRATGYSASFLKPRAFILIGNSAHWSLEKKDGLRKLNYYLHNIQILTYNDLLKRGEQFIAPIGEKV